MMDTDGSIDGSTEGTNEIDGVIEIDGALEIVGSNDGSIEGLNEIVGISERSTDGPGDDELSNGIIVER